MWNSTRARLGRFMCATGLAVVAVAALTADGLSFSSAQEVPPARSSAPPLRQRVPFDRPARAKLRTSDDPRAIVVKFREGTRIRRQGLTFTSTSSARLSAREQGLRDRFSLDDGLIGAQLAAVNRLIAGERDAVVERLFDRPADALEQEQRRGEANSGKELPDLNLYYVIVREAADASSTEALLDQLNALDIVEIAYVETDVRPAGHVESASMTPDLTAEQGYLGIWGVDANAARTQHNARGQNVKIVDIENNWLFDHEDLSDVSLVWGTPWGSDKDHGTAVLGVLAAQDNGYGMIGIAPDASIGVASKRYTILNAVFKSVARAINESAAQLGPGDVILIEQQTHGPETSQPCTCSSHCDQFEYLPMEWDPASFDAILSATANHIIVVEGAGNGSMNLDDPIYGGRFDRAVRDSGAIIVGASLGGSRVPICWTNFGSRVDVQAWGTGVATLGGGDLGVGGSDPRQFYTATFGGTSAASAIVAGVVAAAQGYVTSRGLRLFPEEMSGLLKETGYPQGFAYRHIGPLPNLYRAILAYEAGDSCEPITISGTVDSRHDYIPPFGRRDYCFTVSWLDAMRAVRYVFDTCSGTTFDTRLQVTGPQGLVGTNNNSCGPGSQQSKVAVLPTVEGSYRVRVTGTLGAAGWATTRFVKIAPPIQTGAQ
jgi:serine protease